MMKNQSYLFLVLCNLCWAGNFVFGKLVAQEMSPLWMTLLRWIISVALLLPMAYRYEQANYQSMKTILKNNWLLLSSMGLSGGLLFNVFTYQALQYTSPTNGALVLALTPAMTMIFSFFIFREKMSVIEILGLLVSFVGVVLLLTGGEVLKVFSAQYNRGDLYMLVADLCWMTFAFLCKKASGIPPITATTLSSFIVVCIMLPLSLLSPIHVQDISFWGGVGILYIALFASVLAFSLWNAAVRVAGATMGNLSLNLIPVYTAVITLVLGQQISNAQLWGGSVVIVGLCITLGKKARGINTFVYKDI